MSDEECEQPRQKRIRVCVPVDSASDEFKVHDLDLTIDYSVKSELSLSDLMDEIEGEMSGLVEDETSYYLESKPDENDSEQNESEEINTDWSDVDEKVVSEPFEDDYEPINSYEKEICDFIDLVLNDKLPSDYSKEWPTMYLQHDQKSEVMSEEQFQVYINEKIALLLLSKCTLGSDYNSNNSLLEELDYWKQKLEKLNKKILKLKKITEKTPLKPPSPDKIYHVRNVGISINIHSESSLENLRKCVTF